MRIWQFLVVAVLTLVAAGAGAPEAVANPWSFLQNPAPRGPRTATQPLSEHLKPVAPSEAISPLRNPMRYFAAAMSETPVAQAARNDASSNRTASAARSSARPLDSIALDAPAGPPTPQLYISLGQMFERQGNIPQAREQFRRAVSMWPRDIEVLRAAARMEDRQGRLPVAESLYRRAIAVNPQEAAVYNDLGLCLARQGRIEHSVQELEQAVYLQPGKALYRNNVATVLIELGQDQMALAHLSAVHGLAVSNYNMGQLLLRRHRTHDALAYFQAALGANPEMAEAKLAIARLDGSSADPARVASEPQRSTQPQPANGSGPSRPPQQATRQQSVPATARGPAVNTSSQWPGHEVQRAPADPTRPPAPAYRSAAVPRYLPPVQSMTPGRQVR